MHKSGFVNIIGHPNVGKSTLMNALTGEKLAIISPKVQTTRHRIMGIVSGEDFQIVYSDTPGILKPHYLLQETMLNYVKTALSDADILLYVTDVFEKIENIDENILSEIRKLTIPKILIINKIDLTNQENLEKIVQKWNEKLPNTLIFPTSALHKFQLSNLFEKIISLLPESPAYFDKESLTDKSERFIASEIIREKILLHYEKEIPYSVEIVIEEFKTEGNLLKINSLIFVMRETQKGIIIGEKGNALKRVATEARKDMEKFFGKKVFLQVFVKVDKDWRDNPKSLKRFGYIE